MQWTPGGTSEDIEDRRGDSGGGGGGGFGYGPHLGIGGTLVLLVLSFIFKQNLFSVFSGGGSYSEPPSSSASRDPRGVGQGSSDGEEREVQFVSFVIDDVQRTWEKLLPPAGASYRHAKL